MTAFTTSYSIRYSIPSIQQQIEVSTVHSAKDIQGEDPATPDHANRLAWAEWVVKNSSAAWLPFSWPVALNPSIISTVEADPTGLSVGDSDVQFVVNAYLPAVIDEWVASQAPATS
jgi:hypothetical protein